MAESQQLKIFDYPEDLILTTANSMIKRGEAAVIQQSPKNNSIMPNIVQLTDSTTYHLLKATTAAETPVDGFSHCWACVGGKKRDLQWLLHEAGSSQHPRMVIESGGDKVQIYHVVFYASLLSEQHTLLGSEFDQVEKSVQLQLLSTVTRKNTVSTSSELTVAHLCGNSFCVRPSHLRVVAKRLNEEHTCCHWLQGVQTDARVVRSVREACPHTPKCVFVKYIFE
jgi:hypothetical protein